MIEALAFLGALAAGLPLTLLAVALARRVRLVDVPDGRKRHLGEVPLAGGIAVFATVAIVMGVAVSMDLPAPPWVVAVLVLSVAALSLGIVDDYHDLNAKLRLVVQIVIALVLTIVFDVRLVWLGDVLGTGAVGFEYAGSVAFTVFCVVGVVNATNMLDGMNGLLAAVVSISFVAIGALSFLAGDVTTPALCAAFVGALAAFLAFNLGAFGDRRRIFLGDSGSMMLGLVLATLLVGRSQNYAAAITPVAAGWLLGLPLLDAATVMARRLRERRSPLAAGRDHLHHRLQNLGLSPRESLVVMAGVQVAMVGIGLVAQFSELPAWLFFYGFVALAVACFLMTFGLEDRSADTALRTVSRIGPAGPKARSTEARPVPASHAASHAGTTPASRDKRPLPATEVIGRDEPGAERARRAARLARVAEASAD